MRQYLIENIEPFIPWQWVFAKVRQFYLEDKIAIKDLIHLFAVNAKTFDYEAFMTKTEVEDLPVAGI